jgi:hypothetical protein
MTANRLNDELFCRTVDVGPSLADDFVREAPVATGGGAVMAESVRGLRA